MASRTITAEGEPLPVLASEPDPVFIVGMNGSGTSMLTESLGRHPELYGFPGETRMLPHLIDRAKAAGTLTDDETFLRLWTYVLDAVPSFSDANDGRKLPVPANWRDYPRSLAAILDAVFRYLASREGKVRWCEKSPNNSEHLLSLAALYPRARFVHIIRDGRDCAASTNRRQHRDPSLTIYRWRLVVNECRRQGKTLAERYFELRYEDLTNHPREWMTRICEFLGLEFLPDVLQSAMPQSGKRESLQPGSVGKIEPNSMKWRAYFSDRQLRRLEQISGELLAELDYPVVFHRGSRNLGIVRAKGLRLIDFFRANRRLRSKLAGDKSITWREIATHALASVREYRAKKY